MKIGVLTFHRAINYGAILQAYALQKVLKKYSNYVEVVDYRSFTLEERHHRMKFSFNIKESLIFLLFGKNYNRKFSKFRDFLDTYIEKSCPVFSKEELQRLAEKYDVLFTGSDQVWNTVITNGDFNYFLDFSLKACIKASYAASFGCTEVPFVNSERVYAALSDFKAISIRESSGQGFIQMKYNLPSTLVLDPTMLLSQEEWALMAKPYKKVEDYILLYCFGAPSGIFEYAEKVSHKYGKRIVVISTHKYRKLKNVIYEKCIGPQEFVGLFMNAFAVITNSFHGTVFSILFNKPLLVDLLPLHTEVDVNSRLLDVLELLGLKSQQITVNTKINQIMAIDYTIVNKRISEVKKCSIDFLESLLKSE